MESIIYQLLKKNLQNEAALIHAKRNFAEKYRLPLPSNAQLLKAYRQLLTRSSISRNTGLEHLLRKRKIRSLSGVAVVSVLTKPYPCRGKCIYCPTQPGIPKSYLDKEPAVMRALFYKYDPYMQVRGRIKTLEDNGHQTDKIDLRIIGGTWTYNPTHYQNWFIARCFEACNDYGSKLKTKNVKIQPKTKNLEQLQKENETAKHRIVGINVETRPDAIDIKEIRRLRKLGVTQIELGVQSVYDDVLKINQRGHGIDAVARATKLLKDAGFKTCYHMMPNLPGSTPKKDIAAFRELFGNPDFQPDHLKIYPCALVKEAPLYWLKDRLKYKSYSTRKLVDIIKSAKRFVPYYCRIQRIARDIPAGYIVEGGSKISNLREIIAREILKEGWRCKCIRCREVGGDYDPKEKTLLFRQDYSASEGKEIFLSFENKNRTKIYSLLRLRIPSYVLTNARKEQPVFPSLKNSALIREIHTYGQLHPISDKSNSQINSPQHKGFGRRLIAEAERIAKQEFRLNKIAVISAVGTREYYRKWGYHLRDTYMMKRI